MPLQKFRHSCLANFLSRPLHTGCFVLLPPQHEALINERSLALATMNFHTASPALLSLALIFPLLVAPASARGGGSGWSSPLQLGTSGICTYHDVADLNHDGRPDLVVATRNTSRLHVFLNSGSRSFLPDASIVSAGDVISVAVADLNGDGHQDLLAVGYGDQTLLVHWGAGDGTFSTGPSYVLGSYGHGIVVRDLNADGWPDVAVSMLGPDRARVYWNDGAGALVPGPELTTESTPYFINAEDLDADSDVDLVVTNYGSGSVRVYLSDGLGAFTAQTPISTGGTNPGRVAIADLDGDGVPDLAVPHRWSSSLTWFHGNGNGSFAFPVAIPVATAGDNAGFWADVGDVDLDGRPDLVFGNGAGGRVNISRQTAPGVFAAAQDIPAGLNQNAVRLADFDGNGSLDISTSALDSNALVVLFNDIADCNGNSIADSVDTSVGGGSADCDGDTTPDECQITLDPSRDLNSNGVLDTCECSVTRYCIAAPNSVGPGALMDHAGTVSIGLDNLTLLCSGCPPNASGLFFYGPQQAQAVFGNGYRCVGGPVTRTGVTVASSSGLAARSLNYGSLPATGTITVGSTWNFQFWYRNPAAGGAGFNLSDGISIHFCP